MKSVIICDMEGLITNMNEGAEKVFGYTSNELVGIKRVSIFSPGEIVLQNVLGWLRDANETGEHITKTNFIRKDGSKFAAKIKITPNFADGKDKPQTGYCGITEVIDQEVNIKINWVTKIIKGVAITRVGFASASLFPVFSIGCYYAGVGDNLFSPISLALTTFGILFFHLFSNLYNDYFDVTHGTDEANTEYFNAGMDSTILQGAQLSGGSRAVELGLITLKGTKSLANVMFILGLATAVGILYMSFLNTGSTSNAYYSAIIALIGVFVGYFYTAKPIRLSSRYGLGELSIFLSFGPLLTLGTGFAISNETILLYSNEFYNLLLLGVPIGLLTTNILFINQYPDHASDKKVGKNHLVVLLGKKASRWIYALNLILALGSLYFIAENILTGTKQMLFLYMLIPITMFYSYFLLSGLFKYYNSRKLIKYNIHTIYFHMFFSFIYMVILANFQ
jgi:1,4-dihydroxy-2-naphthoate octaprenyltransferase|tara:strand:+ start:4216 stop:5568 length:1353 start_codon:yes stop_codon:yes gene_type:complete